MANNEPNREVFAYHQYFQQHFYINKLLIQYQDCCRNYLVNTL